MTWRASFKSGTKAGSYASRPASGTTIGERYRPTDGGPDFVWDGTLWRPQFETVLGYEPSSSGWSAIDGGTGAAVAFSKGVLSLTGTSIDAGVKLALGVRSFSGSGDFSLTTRVRPKYTPRNSGGGTANFFTGLCLRDSGTGAFIWFNLRFWTTGVKTLTVNTMNSATSYGTDLWDEELKPWADDSAMWLRIVNSGTTRSFDLSNNGRSWHTIFSHSGGSRSPLSPDQAGLAHQGFISSSSASFSSGIDLESWAAS